MVLIVQVWVSLFVGLMCIVWVAAVVLPFVFLEGKAARPAEGPSVTDVLQVQNLQEAGFLYSYYPRYSEKESAYRFDLAYPFTLLATYVIGLLVLVRYSLKGFPAFPLQDKKAAPGFLSLFGLFSIDRKNQKKFSNATFSSWNFNLVSIETSRQYRRGMRQKFQIMLQEAALEKNKVDIQMFNALKGQNILLFFTSVLVWPFMVGAVAIGVNYVITEMESIEVGIGIKYAPAVAIWAIMKASSAFNRALLGIEKWPKSFRYLYQLRFSRFFFTRAFGLGSLVYHMYHNIKFQEDFTTPGNPFGQTCPEQVFGEFLYRLAIANLVCECFLCSLYIIIRRNIGKAVTLNVEESLAEAAFLLGLFLSGVLLAPYIGFIIAFQVSSFFRPASTFAAMCSWPDVPPPLLAEQTFVQYKFNRFALRRHYKAPNYEIAYQSSSLSSWLIRVMLIAALVISSFPVVYFMYAKHPNCGPHMGSTVAQIVSVWVDESPIFVKTLLRWVFHPLLLLSFVVICVTGMLFMRTRLRESKQSNEELIRHSSRNVRELQTISRGEGGALNGL